MPAFLAWWQIVTGLYSCTTCKISQKYIFLPTAYLSFEFWMDTLLVFFVFVVFPVTVISISTPSWMSPLLWSAFSFSFNPISSTFSFRINSWSDICWGAFMCVFFSFPLHFHDFSPLWKHFGRIWRKKIGKIRIYLGAQVTGGKRSFNRSRSRWATRKSRIAFTWA